MRERRTATRFNFGGIAEVSVLGTPQQLIGLTRDLSLSGCFVRTKLVFPEGTDVRVQIISAGKEFSAIGKVTANINSEGMGIQFVQIDLNNLAVIEKWLGFK